MELPNSKYGFQPPTEHIELISEESWIGIKAMCTEALSCVEKVLFIPQKLYPKYLDYKSNDKHVEIKNQNYTITIVPKV